MVAGLAAAKDLLISTTMPLMATRWTERRLVTMVTPNQQHFCRLDVGPRAMSVDNAVRTMARARREGVTTTPGSSLEPYFPWQHSFSDRRHSRTGRTGSGGTIRAGRLRP